MDQTDRGRYEQLVGSSIGRLVNYPTRRVEPAENAPNSLNSLNSLNFLNSLLAVYRL